MPHPGYELLDQRTLALLLLATIVACGIFPGPAMAVEPDPEASVCGALREPLAFWAFRRGAGSVNAGRVAGIADIEPVVFTTRDGRKLSGYRMRVSAPTGYLLVAQGNATLVDQIAHELQYFRRLGVDIYLYDYRGYGLSEGKSRLRAIVEDYRQIAASLNAQPYRRRLLYGMSMGGVILLDAVGATGDYTALVVDSSPSRISQYGCPKIYDPVRQLPPDSSRILVIGGERDRVVPIAQMEELMRSAQSRGAQVLRDPELAHPFMDAGPDLQQRRFQAIAEFLAR
jgi:alpha-beta hydrolase superfamily lysophospholipase